MSGQSAVEFKLRGDIPTSITLGGKETSLYLKTISQARYSWDHRWIIDLMFIMPECGCEYHTTVWISDSPSEGIKAAIVSEIQDMYESDRYNYGDKCPICQACDYILDDQCDAPMDDWEIWEKERLELSEKKPVCGKLYIKENEVVSYSIDDCKEHEA